MNKCAGRNGMTLEQEVAKLREEKLCLQIALSDAETALSGRCLIYNIMYTYMLRQ